MFQLLTNGSLTIYGQAIWRSPDGLVVLWAPKLRGELWAVEELWHGFDTGDFRGMRVVWEGDDPKEGLIEARFLHLATEERKEPRNRLMPAWAEREYDARMLELEALDEPPADDPGDAAVGVDWKGVVSAMTRRYQIPGEYVRNLMRAYTITVADVEGSAI